MLEYIDYKQDEEAEIIALRSSQIQVELNFVMYNHLKKKLKTMIPPKLKKFPEVDGNGKPIV